MRHGSGIERRRHDHDAQLRPRLLQAFQQCQRQVAVQVALVELIQHHGGDTL